MYIFSFSLLFDKCVEMDELCYSQSCPSGDSFQSLDVGSSFYTSGISPGNTGQVCIRKSLGQGHSGEGGRKSLFSQCKSSVGNNSCSIKHRGMWFACSVGFSDIVDWMAWPPSFLPSDRKWPHVIECMHWQVVGLSLVIVSSLQLRFCQICDMCLWPAATVMSTRRPLT